MRKIISAVVLAFAIASCSTPQRVLERETVTQIRTVETILKDTLLTIPADSAFYKLYVDCVNGKPVLRDIANSSNSPEKTNHTSEQNKKPPKATLNGNELNITCYQQAQKLFFSWKEKYIKEEISTQKTIQLPPVPIEKKLSWWQQLWISLGKFYTVIAIGWTITKIPWRRLFLP